MQTYDTIQQQNNERNQQVDIHSYPLPIRIKHPSWAVRKGTYQQILYYLKIITNLNQQILISGTAYTIDTLLPHFQMLVHEKHASVLLKGLQCVQQILKVDKKLSGKHCIKTLIDKGIQYFPLMSQQRKGILEKFLDVLELSKVDAIFLKNKLNLPHEKSVMYVIEVIGVLNMTQLKSGLIALSKKHQKKCVRELAAEIAQQLQSPTNQLSANQQQPFLNQKLKPPITSKSTLTSKSSLLPPSTCKLTIQKLPHYQQLPSKKQQQYSLQLVQKISLIIQQYSLSQVPSFSHVLRLMMDDNNHIVNVNAIKVMIRIFEFESCVESSISSNKSLIPQSFPLLFIFNKFKLHKTHSINSLLLSLVEAILKSSTNRITDLLLALSEGLNCPGSKANIKFGCSLTFFRIISLIYSNEDLYVCTTNQNIQNQNQDLMEKFNYFEKVKLTKNQLKIVQKIISILEKDKKYDTEIYLIRYAIGLQEQMLFGTENYKDKDKGMKQNSNYNVSDKQLLIKQKKSQTTIEITNNNSKSTTKLKPNKLNQKPQIPPPQIPTRIPLTGPKTSTKFTQINLQFTLNKITKFLNNPNQPLSLKQLKCLLQKSSQQFYSCVRQHRYEMFYLCELLQSFIQNYMVNEQTIQYVSQYLTNLLKIISLLKPMVTTTLTTTQQSLVKYKQIAVSNVTQLLLVSLCKLAIGQDIQEVMENLNTNYGYQVIFQSLQTLFIITRQKQLQNKIKKKNKKHLIQWLQSNTPLMFINTSDYYKLIQAINDSKKEKKQKNDNKNIIKQQTISQSIIITQSNSLKQQPKLKQKLLSNKSNKVISQQQYQSLQSSRKKHLEFQLQNINISKIQNNPIESNYYDQDQMDKSSFHQNIQQQLKQITTERSLIHYKDKGIQLQQQQDLNMSKEYLKMLDMDKFKKKDGILKQQEIPQNAIAIDNYYEQQQYTSKFQQVEQRRLQRQKQRREFMDRMKCEYKPIIKNYMENSKEEINQQEGEENSDSSDDSERVENDSTVEKHEGILVNKSQENSNIITQPEQQHQQQQLPFLNLAQSPSFAPQQQTLSPPNNKPTIDDSSFLSTNSTGQLKYKFINHQKLSYMLKSTTNPYPHLRNLILIPFKSSPKKHSFLQQLFHFYTHHVEFKSPQPYTGLVLLTILMFSQIKQDKTLIQPLQSLYELVAKQSTTNQFLKTIITLFHTVIQQTLLVNRKFLITILLKSMIRMLPFIENGVSLLRDIQQFYQIGEMVYFEMFEEEYKQIKGCLKDEGVHVIVEKALEEEGDNLKTIVEGWLATEWKVKVIEAIDQLHQYQDQEQQYHDYNYNQQQHHCDQQEQKNYQSYI